MKRVLKPEELKRIEAYGNRCQSRHPNWLVVRCEREATPDGFTPHVSHHAEGRRFEWVDDRTAY